MNNLKPQCFKFCPAMEKVDRQQIDRRTGAAGHDHEDHPATEDQAAATRAEEPWLSARQVCAPGRCQTLQRGDECLPKGKNLIIIVFFPCRYSGGN